jgi:hypothetical protein
MKDRLSLARADHHLHQRAADRSAGLEAVDLVVAIEIEKRARVRRVIRKPHVVSGQESSGANSAIYRRRRLSSFSS